MRLKPADISAYFKYEGDKIVGVELFHRPTGISSGLQSTREYADQMLRQAIEVMCGDRCGGCPNCQT